MGGSQAADGSHASLAPQRNHDRKPGALNRPSRSSSGLKRNRGSSRIVVRTGVLNFDSPRPSRLSPPTPPTHTSTPPVTAHITLSHSLSCTSAPAYPRDHPFQGMADLKALLLNGADEAVSVNQRALVYIKSIPSICYSTDPLRRGREKILARYSGEFAGRSSSASTARASADHLAPFKSTVSCYRTQTSESQC